MSSIPISTVGAAEKQAQQAILAGASAVDQRAQTLKTLEAEAASGAVSEDQVSLAHLALLDAKDGVVSVTTTRNQIDAQLFTLQGQSPAPALKEEVDNQANHVQNEQDRVAETQQQLQRAQSRFQAGIADSTAVGQAQAEVSSATSLLHQAEAEFLVAQANLQGS